MEKFAKKYFDSHAHPRSLELASLLEDFKFDSGVVIPARNEKKYIFRCIESLQRASVGKNNLLVLVLNATSQCSDSSLQENLEILHELRILSGRKIRLGESFLITATGLSVLVANFSERPSIFSPDQGVGTARKIGFDTLARAWMSKRIKNPYVFSTDADAIVPSNYFNVIDPDDSAVAFNFPFQHESESENSQEALATNLYDLFLKYYAEGLSYADSPYAFATLGSTMAVHLNAYMKVRGFPERLPGEDFYLLNKIAKQGKVINLARPTLRLSGRLCGRVAIGTGSGIRKYLIQLKLGQDVEFYDPESFVILKRLLLSFKELAKHRDLKKWKYSLAAEIQGHAYFDNNNCPELFQQAIDRSSNPEAIEQSIHIWFDAFRTLKFIHHLRDQGLRPRAWYQAVREAPFKLKSFPSLRVPSKSASSLVQL